MRRLFTSVALIAVAAAGCITERDTVRGDREIQSAPPPPADPGYMPSQPAPQSYQAEAPPPPPAGTDVSSDAVFYERLSPYGSWTFVAPYGHVWVPAVGYGWRPYYYGQWVLTDWGWTFVSDDPWGWAGYHYGRWNWGVGVGWYWIPGTVWGPAWVDWRYGGGYVTWCPLGPPGVAFGYRHPAWVAVPEQHFTRPIAAFAAPRQRTYGFVRQAQPLTGVHATVARRGSFGPPVAAVTRATGQPVRPIAATQAVRPRPTTASPSPGVMRSPMQPRARVGGSDRAVRPGVRTYGAPHVAPHPTSAPPARIESAPAPAGGNSGPHASPPAPAPSGGNHGGGHGGGPHATSGKPQ
jgi:hypothetical protein